MTEISEDELQQIAEIIASLPSKALLDRCRKEEQINEWHNYRKNHLLLAEGWRAEFILCQGDPIGDALEKGEISKHRHDLLQQRVTLYKYQWALVKEANKYVAELHSAVYTLLRKVARRWLPDRLETEYPFQSAFELFAETLREEVDGSLAWCLEPYYEVPVKKWGKATKLLRENIEKADAGGIYPELKKTEVQNLKNKVVWDKMGFSWLGVTLLVCQFVALRDPQLRKKLTDFNRALAEFCKVGVRASRKVAGFAWNKGKTVPASKAGGIYREPE
ncbi:MAG: hypothetical protein MUC60_01300 [Oscillatoria sp. Prado101]|nr:hypothetical protein [Oscillatoria sp. Prado101]